MFILLDFFEKIGYTKRDFWGEVYLGEKVKNS